MKTVNITINGMPLTVPNTYTILEAAREAGFNIPTLCYLKEMNEIGACRICVVEVKGARSLVASCVYPVAEGMEIYTNSKRVQDSRRMTLELILSNHQRKCLSCSRSGHCELQNLCREYGVEDEGRYDGAVTQTVKDESTAYLVRDNSKCVLCRRCVAACQAQEVAVIGANARGFDTSIGCAFERPLNNTPCIGCGQCIVNCPTGALQERDNTAKVWEALGDPNKHVVVQTAPAVRAALGESFGLPIGTNVEGKMVAALRRLGFDKVFDTNFGADLTIMEEANEFVERFTKGGVLPMITSCSPGWVKYCEHYYPEFIPNLSTCKSPQQMTGAMIKTWYAKKNNLNPEDIVVVSIMPCTAKKFEIGREDESASGYPDVDVALTTRELARMIERAHIQFTSLKDEAFDQIMGEFTGAAVIFGATGGVMEAALRTAADWVTGQDLQEVEYQEVRGTEGVKVATYKIGDATVKVGVASGTGNAKKLLERVKAGEKFDFIEIMGCPGGCVNGGGQPLQPASVRNFEDLKGMRAKALYEEDKNLPLRKSHQSPLMKLVYEEYLEKPGSHIAHETLHTSYVKRGKEVR
ncbi:MAG TPA: [FeFe] hydrogenase, group A [Firmicutes bacterium]|nr:[FeFe] hydrogenase, group A [Bacillota bacterium]